MFKQALIGLSVAGIVAVNGCSREAAIEVLNTSGQRWRVTLSDSALKDVYWIDSLDTGKSLRWPVPAHARGKKMFLMISPPPDVVASNAGTPTRGWGDSLVLNRNWTVQIHSARFVEGTASWHERAKRLGTSDRFDLPPTAANPFAEAFDTWPASTRSSDAPHMAPNVEVQDQHGWGGSNRMGGFLFMTISSVLAMWAVVYAVSGRILKRSERFGRASGFLVGAVTSIAILLGLQNSGDDAVPSYLLGKIAGRVFILIPPIAIAIVVELRRRKARV